MSGAEPYIPNLSTAIEMPSGFYFIGAQGNQNNAQRISAQAVLEWIEAQLSGIALQTYYAAPSATGFSVDLPDTSENLWLVLTPVAGYAAGTIVLPDVSDCVDQQSIQVNCTQSVSTLTIDGNGATVTGAPTTLAANAFFSLRFDAVTRTWYRVG